MHELSIAQSLIDLVEEEGSRRGFAQVSRVTVEIGALGHVEPEALAFCFDAASFGSIAQGARLDLRVIAARGRCLACRAEVEIGQRYDLCPVCGKSYVEMTAGDELRVTELEVGSCA